MVVRQTSHRMIRRVRYSRWIQMLYKCIYLLISASSCSHPSSDSIHPLLFMTHALIEILLYHLHELCESSQEKLNNGLGDQLGTTWLAVSHWNKLYCHFPLQVHVALVMQEDSWPQLTNESASCQFVWRHVCNSCFDCSMSVLTLNRPELQGNIGSYLLRLCYLFFWHKFSFIAVLWKTKAIDLFSLFY